MRGIGGKTLLILLLFVYFLFTFADSAINGALQEQYEILNATDEFIDKIIDSRTLTDAMLKEYEAKLAGFDSLVTYEVTRKMRVLEPDSMNGGQHVVSYIVADDNTRYNQGDQVCVHIKEERYGSALSIAQNIFGVFVPKLDVTFAERVR